MGSIFYEWTVKYESGDDKNMSENVDNQTI